MEKPKGRSTPGYRVVAKLYNEGIVNPKDISEHTGFSRKKIHAYTYQARQRGLIPPATGPQARNARKRRRKVRTQPRSREIVVMTTRQNKLRQDIQNLPKIADQIEALEPEAQDLLMAFIAPADAKNEQR